MPYFFCKLLPPRPTFVMDMTDDERALMTRHAAYWGELVKDGRAVVFGPVADPAGAFGMGVLNVEGVAAAEAISAQDPAIVEGQGFGAQVFPMPVAVHA